MKPRHDWALITLIGIGIIGALFALDDSYNDQMQSASVLDEAVAQERAEHKRIDHQLHVMQIQANNQLGMK
jgi:mannose/fructose/N-acetylgalactosamine-specific phosphotransferase system component IIC